MSRYFKKITLAELFEKIQPLMLDDDFPFNLPKSVEKDLKKVNFDWENYEYGVAYPAKIPAVPSTGEGFMNYPCGFQELPNGMAGFFINAGGDWETPVCFVVYWDGTQLRGYIPTNGNMFNRKTKWAFGNEGEQEEEQSNEDTYKMIKALLQEATWLDAETLKKYEEDLQREYEDENAIYALQGMDLSNKDAIYKDIMERIVEK